MATAEEFWDVIDQGDDPLMLPVDRLMSRVIAAMRERMSSAGFVKWWERVTLPESADTVPESGPWSEEAMAGAFRAGTSRGV